MLKGLSLAKFPFFQGLNFNPNPKPKLTLVYVYTYFFSLVLLHILACPLTYSPSRVKPARTHTLRMAFNSQFKSKHEKFLKGILHF